MKKNLAYLLIITNLLCNSSYSYEVKYLEVGQVAPWPGYSFDVPSEKKLRLWDSEYEYQKKLSVSLESINKSYEQQVSIMQTRIDNQQKEIKELNENDGFLGKYGLFLLGCITTTAIAFAVNKVSQWIKKHLMTF